jgi:cytochrome c-type biogenesis protein CcmH/NrfG
MPSMKAVRASVDRYFDGSHSSSLSMSLPLETDEATTVVRQREEQAQAAARSVFDAKAKKRRYGMGWLAAVPIVLLLFGAGGYYYWTLLERPSQWRSPGAALAPAQPAPAASAPASQPAAPPPAPTVAASEVAAPVTGPASEPTAAAGVEAAADTEDESLEPGLAAASGSDLEPALSEVLGVAPPPSGDLTPAVAEPVTEPVVEPVAVPPEPPPSTEELLASADEQIGAALGDLRVLEQGAIGTHGVSISKRPGPNQVEIGVRAGYQAFQRGDYVAAEVNYRGALQREPQNRDAMLGIAALAMIQQRWAAAAEIYRQLLRMNPRDDVAQTGLLSVEPNVDPSGSETRLKLMLEREPEAHYLYFSLGNLYASSSRWADAQGAFFDAFRLDSGNADYAYNLAVSLEHISKPGPALEYYRRALALAGQQAVRFSKDSVLQRIQVLSKASS